MGTENQDRIAKALGVNRQLVPGDEAAELARRINFIKALLKRSGCEALVLGISGGVDSLTAGRLCQLAVEQLREEGGTARFIAMRLPYRTQADEHDAQASLAFIRPDQVSSANISACVEGLMGSLEVEGLEAAPAQVDFVKGNVKARARMMTQYALANFVNGLVVGTDHAAEALMGFFTKFGDGACDLAPLSGLVKNQVRAIARHFGAPEFLVEKIPTADLEDLAPGKPDEASHGVTYAEIDAFLHGEPVRQEAFDIICRTYEKTHHKREMPFAP